MVEIFCGILFCGIMFMLIYSAFIDDLRDELNYCVEKLDTIIELQQLHITSMDNTIEHLQNIKELELNKIKNN